MLAGPEGAKGLKAVARAAAVVSLLNGLFLLFLLAALGEPSAVRARVHAAFRTGDLAYDDYRFFDARRGFLQSNDCNVLQMIANSGRSRLERAISPIVYSASNDWKAQ